jgi:hypothetical protein
MKIARWGVGFCLGLALAVASVVARAADAEPFLLGPVGIRPVPEQLVQTPEQRDRLLQALQRNRESQPEILAAAALRNLEPQVVRPLSPTRKQKLERMNAIARSAPPMEQWVRLVEQNQRSMQAMASKALDRWNPIGTQIANGDGSTRAMGAVSDIEFAFDPFDNRTTLYLGTIAGGLWKQRLLLVPYNTPISENLAGSPAVGALHVGETGSPFILLGSGAYGRSAGSGLYRSSNNGASWQRIAMQGIHPGSFFKIDRSVSNASRIYACADAGFFESTDSGQTWTQRRTEACTDFIEFGGPQGGIVMVAGWTATSPHLFYAIPPASGAWTWTPANDSGITGSLGRISLAIGNPNSSYVYAYASDANNNGNGIFRSDEYGLGAWQKISGAGQNFGGAMGFYAHAINVSPTNDNVVAAGMVNLYVSTDATQTAPIWKQVVSQLYDHTDVEFVPQSASPGNTLFAFSSDGGVFTYDWTTEVVGKAENNRGMNVQLVMGNNNAMNQSHANRNLLGAGLWDTGSMLVDTSASASTRIRYLTGADGGALSMSGDSASNMIGSFGAPWTRWRSTDTGQTWTQLDNGCSNVEAPMTWAFAFTLEPTTGFANRAFTLGVTGSGASQSYKIYRQSLSAANCSWTALHADNLSALFARTDLGDVFLQVANNPSADLVYVSAASTDKVWTLTGSAPNMTVTQRTPLFTPGAIPGDQSTTYLSADRNPGRPNTAYQVFHQGSAGGRLFLAMTDNAGVTWEDVSGNINTLSQGAQAFELIGNSTDLNQLFVATAIGVFRSDDRGQTWTPYSQGLPASIYVVNLEFDPTVSPPRLLMGSYGRGFYSREVSPRQLPVDIFRNGFE